MLNQVKHSKLVVVQLKLFVVTYFVGSVNLKLAKISLLLFSLINKFNILFMQNSALQHDAPNLLKLLLLLISCPSKLSGHHFFFNIFFLFFDSHLLTLVLQYRFSISLLRCKISFIYLNFLGFWIAWNEEFPLLSKVYFT